MFFRFTYQSNYFKDSNLIVVIFHFQTKTEQIINQYNNQVQTLPYATASRFDQNVSLETTLDLRAQGKVDDVRKMSGPVFPR